MNPWILFPTLETELACPSRYVRTHLREEYVPAPFASSWLGQAVHERIARSLRRGLPVNQAAFKLPPRLLLQEGETLEALLTRASLGLQHFETDHRPYLTLEILRVEERHTWKLTLHGQPVKLMGKLDLVVEKLDGDEILDWKTGKVDSSRDQLRYYLVLYHRSKGEIPRIAKAIGLETGEVLEEPWKDALEEWVQDRTAMLVDMMRRALTEPDRLEPGPQCKYCPFAHTCTASQAPPRYLMDTRTGQITRL